MTREQQIVKQCDGLDRLLNVLERGGRTREAREVFVKVARESVAAIRTTARRIAASTEREG
jgi:hypothetical protein